MRAGNWVLRPWQPRDQTDTASLDRAHGPRHDAPGRQSLTLVAVGTGTPNAAILGAGTLYDWPDLPARWRLALHVHPAHRRQGIGTALLDALVEEAAKRDDRALQIGLSHAATDGLDFFVKRGFNYLMRTRLGRLDPSRIPDSTWMRISESERWAQRLAIQIRATANPQDRTVLTPAIAKLHEKIYQQTHAWSPPAPLEPEQAIAAFLGDDLIPEALFVAIDGDRPIGVSSLRRTGSATEFDLGWTGVLTEFGSHVPDLTLALLGHALSFARAAKQSISIEVDAADKVLWELMGTLPVAYEPDWLNLERPGGGRPSPPQSWERGGGG